MVKPTGRPSVRVPFPSDSPMLCGVPCCTPLPFCPTVIISPVRLPSSSLTALLSPFSACCI